MREELCDFIVDLGNSFIKIGAFDGHNISVLERIPLENQDRLLNVIKGKRIILTSVTHNQITELIGSNCTILFEVNRSIKLPFKSKYKTPETWGMDRACNVAGAQFIMPKKNVLVVDIGTCIKFDFINANSEYEGGSISPGINLRFKSLKEGTARLPLQKPKRQPNLIGQSTEESILSGVMKGCNAEIKGMIQEYLELKDNLTVILTGGDAKYFEFTNKSNIFAEENLTLYGLFNLFLFNAK